MKTGQQWIRVSGPNLCPENAVREATKKGVYESTSFKRCCESAGVPVTKRQASKWANKKGAAYNLDHNIPMNGFVPASTTV